MAQVGVVVQPPPKVQKGMRLWPPPVAGLTTDTANIFASDTFYAMATLIDAGTDGPSDALVNNNAVTGVKLDHGNGITTIGFLFPYLIIDKRGDFVIRFDVYKQQGEESAYQGSAYSIQISVSNRAQTTHRPSSTERQFMQALRDVGVNVPSSSH